MKLIPNRTGRVVYDVYMIVNGRHYFSRRYTKRYLADRAAQYLDDRYRATSGKATIKTIQPEKGRQAT